MNESTHVPITVHKPESIGAIAYFIAYLAYLFFHPESETLHWISLVLLPLLYLFVIRRGDERRVRSVLASLGLRRGNLSKWVGWAVLIGLGLSALQLLLSWRAEKILELILSGKALYLFPLTFVLMFVTAGFTEEVFFRGFLQTRIERLFQSKAWGLIVTSLFFGLYHLPYAYLNPNWPSAGDWLAALTAAMIQGVPGGWILGGIYLASDRNLLACIITHSLINSLPAMTMIRFGGS